MKLNVKVKCIAVGVLTLGAVQFSHAKGDFIPFPINCTAQGRMDQTSEIQVSIRIDQGGHCGIS